LRLSQATSIKLVEIILEWKIEPNRDAIKLLAERHLWAAISFEKGDVSVTLLADGNGHKVYNVVVGSKSGVQECVFRVALGLDPFYKVESDVATTEYVRRHTTIPVPKIYIFDSSTNNELGVEWMIMEKNKGTRLSDSSTWGHNCLDAQIWDAKTKLAELLASWVDQLSRQKFDKIGSLYINWSQSSSDIVKFDIGRCVDLRFLEGRRLHFDINRGPYDSSAEYLLAFINIRLRDRLNLIGADTPLPNHSFSRACEGLNRLVPRFFPGQPHWVTMLPCRNLHERNIIMGEDGEPVGVLDWEKFAALPAELFQISSGRPRVLNELFEKDVSNMKLLEFFKRRLEELEPPWLSVFGDRPDIKQQGKTLEKDNFLYYVKNISENSFEILQRITQ
ncbi:MAG: hypothetical protein M1835_000833, partial [Candelina submexicana]